MKTKQTLFEKAGNIFDGKTDSETGLRVLRLRPPGLENGLWSTVYHQFRCFLEGGRKVLLHERAAPSEKTYEVLLDLATGRTERPFPPDHKVLEVADNTGMAVLLSNEAGGNKIKLWNLRADREEAAIASDGWIMNVANLLHDGQRAIAIQNQGKPYEERVQSRHILLTPGEQPKVILEADGYLCNHIQGCPTDPELYTYDRWPSPLRDVDQVLHLRRLDGSLHEPVPLAPSAIKPGNFWGVRDHYIWTPDGKRIISYLSQKPFTIGPDFNHFLLEWWLSALDWRTGEDFSALYPQGRWGGHMHVSPDSKWIICAGGPGFDKLFLVSINNLRKGWNERIVCSYPRTVSSGKNEGAFPYPVALPDQSGILFNAGWPGQEHGVYLAAWPKIKSQSQQKTD